MSSYKAADQGPAHKRIPDDVAQNPTILGHEFSGRLLKVGKKWADRFQPGQMYAIQPALNYKGSLDSPGYSYRYIGGDATKILIPQEVMLMDCLLPYHGDAFFKASLAEPMSCIVGAFRAQYHYQPGSYAHEMGIREGGNCALLAAAGPMGLGAADFALHGPRKPRHLLVTDIDEAKLARARGVFPQAKAAREGVELTFLNTQRLPGGPAALTEHVRKLTGGLMLDDVFVFYPAEDLVQQADVMLARNGCLNFFAGPSHTDFAAKLNFYNVHYEGHHVVGTSGGNTEDMRISLALMSEGRINPAAMVTHVGGLDAAVETILNLPSIPGAKKLIYTHVRMPLTPIDEFGRRAQEAEPPFRTIFQELDRLVKAANGLWSAEAERFLLSRQEFRSAED